MGNLVLANDSTIGLRAQRTLKKPVEYRGTGLHSGKEIQLRGRPAEAGNGVTFIRTDIEAELYDRTGTFYTRIPFALESIPEFDLLTLRIRYDDGFIAYLNGEEVARRNARAGSQWDSLASASHPDSQASVLEDIDITDFRDSLRVGDNLLAIHGMNRTLRSSDLLVDPRLDVSTSVAAEIEIAQTTRLKLRRLVGGEWSPLTEALFDVDTGLRVSELMYHPPAPTEAERALGFFNDDDFEFIELFNRSDSTVLLNGLAVSDGVLLVFRADASIPPGGAAVIVSNRAAFEARYGSAEQTGISILGEYQGQLANSGEKIVLLNPLGEILVELTYDDAWYTETDGDGHTLVAIDLDPRVVEQDAASWRASDELLGSPGLVGQ